MYSFYQWNRERWEEGYPITGQVHCREKACPRLVALIMNTALLRKHCGHMGRKWRTCSHIQLAPVWAEKFYKTIIGLHCLNCGCYLQYSLALKISLCHEIVLSIVFYCLTVAVLGRIWSVGRLRLGSSWTSLLESYLCRCPKEEILWFASECKGGTLNYVKNT